MVRIHVHVLLSDKKEESAKQWIYYTYVHVHPPTHSPIYNVPIGHSKLQAQFQSMEVRNSCFAAFIDFFTPNTYVMVIMSDPTIRESTPNASILLHIHRIISTCIIIYTSDAVHFMGCRTQSVYIHVYTYICSDAGFVNTHV